MVFESLYVTGIGIPIYCLCINFRAGIGFIRLHFLALYEALRGWGYASIHVCKYGFFWYTFKQHLRIKVSKNGHERLKRMKYRVIKSSL